MSDILNKDVVQANPLIEARKVMNVTEMRLFILGLQDIKPHIKDDIVHDVDFRETVIPYTELTKLFCTEYNGNITNLKSQVKKASRCVIELSSSNGGFGFAAIYRKIKYEPNEGLIIQFNDEMKPYILEIVNQAYTRYKVKALFTLSSAYAWRILELLFEKQGYMKQGHKEIFVVLTIEELRFKLNVEEGKYEGRINNFRKYILDNPMAEINEKTDYCVWYEVQKTGRKVTGFKFWLRVKDKKKDEQSYEAKLEQETGQTRLLESPPAQIQQGLTDEQQQAYDSLINRGVSPTKADKLAKKYDLKRIKSNLEMAVTQKETSRNLPGLIISLIEQDAAGKMEIEKQEARARIKQRQQERRQAYDDFHGTTLVKIGKKEEEKEEEKTEKSELKELTNIEVEMIKMGKTNPIIRKRMERLGLTEEDVKEGKRK